MAYNPDHPIYTAIFLKDGKREVLSALREQELVNNLVKLGVFEVDLATDANATEGYCINVTADINLALFKRKPRVPVYVPRATSCDLDRAAWMAGVGRYGEFGR